ncbi:MAG TPA: hypothetical protein VK177_16480 [Flavobacteriales bacterium]|nr:hypothetical protein [Flavobacteriales bacterium]
MKKIVLFLNLLLFCSFLQGQDFTNYRVVVSDSHVTDTLLRERSTDSVDVLFSFRLGKATNIKRLRFSLLDVNNKVLFEKTKIAVFKNNAWLIADSKDNLSTAGMSSVRIRMHKSLIEKTAHFKVESATRRTNFKTAKNLPLAWKTEKK